MKSLVLFLCLSFCASFAWACGGRGYARCGGGCDCSPCNCSPCECDQRTAPSPAPSGCGCREYPLPPDTSYKSTAPAPTPAPKPTPTQPSYPIPNPPHIEGPSVPGTSQPLSATTVQFKLTVPADAQVTVNGKVTTATGPRRTYVSRNLQPGYSYTYDIVVVTGGQTFRGQIELESGTARSFYLNANESSPQTQYAVNP